MSPKFDPKSIPSQAGRVYFITGGTSGLGAQAIQLIASAKPEHIIFTGRNAKNAQSVIKTVKSKDADIKITYLECDNTSLASVRSCAEKFLALDLGRLDVFMANAGIMAWDPSTSKDGYEIQFAVNHIAHALLLKILLPTLEETAKKPGADVRIVNLSSTGYMGPAYNGIDFATLKSSQNNLAPIYAPSKWNRYGQSKLANLLYAKVLAKKHPSIMSVAVHPGYIKTDLFQNTTVVDRTLVSALAGFHWTKVEEGAWNQVWAATSPRSGLENGAYYEPLGKKVIPMFKYGKSEELAEKLWTWTEEELKEY